MKFLIVLAAIIAVALAYGRHDHQHQQQQHNQQGVHCGGWGPWGGCHDRNGNGFGGYIGIGGSSFGGFGGGNGGSAFGGGSPFGGLGGGNGGGSPFGGQHIEPDNGFGGRPGGGPDVGFRGRPGGGFGGQHIEQSGGPGVGLRNRPSGGFGGQHIEQSGGPGVGLRNRPSGGFGGQHIGQGGGFGGRPGGSSGVGFGGRTGEEQLKQKNIIIKGIPSSNDIIGAVRNVIVTLNVGIQIHINSSKKLYDRNGKMAVVAELGGENEVQAVLKKTRNLAGTTIFVEKFLTRDQQADKKAMLQLRKDILSLNKAKKVSVRDDRLFIEGNTFQWNHEKYLVAGQQSGLEELNKIYGNQLVANLDLRYTNLLAKTKRF